MTCSDQLVGPGKLALLDLGHDIAGRGCEQLVGDRQTSSVCAIDDHVLELDRRSRRTSDSGRALAAIIVRAIPALRCSMRSQE